ncbi:MAG: patatin-like phospholipase family protein [Cyclobacteriaceae bacterium]
MKIGLVLSGGGIRGVAHLGLLKALQEFGIEIHMISGASAGALAGAFFAAGISPDDTLELTMNLNRFRFLNPSFSGGVLKNQPLLNFIRKNLPVTTFEELKINLTVIATDYKNAKTKYFDKGDLIMPLLASSTVPVIYQPVEIDGEKYVDGGIVNNLPVEPLVGQCSRIIGSLCNPIDENFQRTGLRSMLERVMLININTNTYPRRTVCDILLEPPRLKNMRVFDFSKALEIFNIGYYHTLKKKDEILKKLSL